MLWRRRRNGHQRWADLAYGDDRELAARTAAVAVAAQREAEALARACTEPTMILECGVRVPYLAHLSGDEL